MTIYMGAHINNSDIRRVLDSIRRIVGALRTFDHEAERKLGISGAQLFVLRQLKEGEGISVNELAERTHTHQSSVSVVVDKLVHRNLVRRARSKKDARSVELSLTVTGQKLLRSAPAAAQEHMISALGRMGDARRRVLANSLSEFVTEIGIEGGKAPLFFEQEPSRKATKRQKRKGRTRNG
jgi:MarR family transcriptional regulator, lower aerobic nicotinate degradation pathway regulator